MKPLVFLNNWRILPVLLSALAFSAPAFAQSELADRDNLKDQQRALYQKLEEQDLRLRALEKEIYSLRQLVRTTQATGADAAQSQSTPPPSSSSAAASSSSPRPALQPPAGSIYTVKEGDTLHSIARQHHATVADLMIANGLKSPDTILLGTRLIIPGPPPAPAVKTGATAQSTPTLAATTLSTHTVREGETLSSIAHAHGASIEAVLKVNGLSNPDRIAVGQELKVPPKGGAGGDNKDASVAKAADSPAPPHVAGNATSPAASPSSSPSPLPETKPAPSKSDNPFPSGYAYYTVVKGDTLYSISKTFGTTQGELLRLNRLSETATILPEQQIVVPMDKYKGPYTVGSLARSD